MHASASEASDILETVSQLTAENRAWRAAAAAVSIAPPGTDVSTPLAFLAAQAKAQCERHSTAQIVARLSPDEIMVRHSARPDVDREYLTVEVSNGWDDVKKICKKVLLFDGKRFTYSGWNSDRNECFFVRSLYYGDVSPVAKIVKK